MRKHILLPALAVVGGLIGAGLRRWQLSDLDADTRLFRGEVPAAPVLAAWLCVLAVAFLLLTRREEKPGDYLGAFGRSPSVAAMGVGGFLMLCAGTLSLWEGVRRFRLYRYGADRLPLMEILTAVLAVVAGVALWFLARGLGRGKLPAGYQVMATLPAYAVLPWLVGTYQDHSHQPEVWMFAVQILAGVCTALGLYAAAAFAFRRAWGRRCLFFSLMGTVLLLTGLADGPGWTDGVMALACAVLLLGQSSALLTAGPAREQDLPEADPPEEAPKVEE